MKLRIWALIFFLSLAFSMRGTQNLKGFSFTVLIFATVSLSLYYPQTFVKFGDFQLKKLIVPLLQIIMFGMGTAMSFNDFYMVLYEFYIAEEFFGCRLIVRSTNETIDNCSSTADRKMNFL